MIETALLFCLQLTILGEHILMASATETILLGAILACIAATTVTAIMSHLKVRNSDIANEPIRMKIKEYFDGIQSERRLTCTDCGTEIGIAHKPSCKYWRAAYMYGQKQTVTTVQPTKPFAESDTAKRMAIVQPTCGECGAIIPPDFKNTALLHKPWCKKATPDKRWP